MENKNKRGERGKPEGGGGYRLELDFMQWCIVGATM